VSNSLKDLLTKPNQPSQSSSTRCYAKRTNVVSLAYLEELRSAIVTSPYVAGNNLSDNFTSTRGFSVVFTRAGIPQVIRQFPYFQTYLEVALKSACNAFYLNSLIIESGGRVATHVDCSLSSYGKVWTIPNLVSVLYVYVPAELQGGELVLENEEVQLAQISPQFNTLIHFIGNLFHSVNPVQSSQPRISLICEQYNLDPDRLQAIPDFEILSAAMSNN
jgi:2OG-Fe(II) oxygenase superfamily